MDYYRLIFLDQLTNIKKLADEVEDLYPDQARKLKQAQEKLFDLYEKGKLFGGE